MSDIVWGVRGGVKLDLCELENAPERQRKAPECPKAFVHDFSLGSTADNAYMLDFNVVTAVKRGYPPTSITWAYHGLRCRPVEVKYFFEVIRWQVTSFQMITGSSLIFFSFIWNMFCFWAAQLKFWFKTDLGPENSASYYRQGRQLLLTLLTMVTRWSRSTSNFYALIGQNLTGEFMRKIYAASWNLFTLTAEADRVLCQLVMFLTVFFHWMHKMKFSCYQEPSVIHG